MVALIMPKKFYNIDTSAQCYETFFGVIYSAISVTKVETELSRKKCPKLSEKYSK